MGILIIIAGIAFVIGFFTWAFSETPKRDKKDEELGKLGEGIVAFVLVSILLAILVIPTLLFTNINTVNKLEVFYDVNYKVYDTAVAMLEQGVDESEGSLFDAANLKQIEYYKQTIADMRNEVAKYNRELKVHKYWQDHWLVSVLVKNVRDDLQYIQIRR